MVHVCKVARNDESVVADQGFASCTDALLTISSKWDVGCACVSAVEGPFCFAVADDEDSGVGHGVVDVIGELSERKVAWVDRTGPLHLIAPERTKEIEIN